jgi:hypothetical protein
MRGTTLLTALLLAASGVRAEYQLYVYKGTKYTGTSKKFTTTGIYPLGFTAESWHYKNESPPACCVNFLHDETNTGYSCGDKDPDSSVASKHRFNKVVVDC